MSNRMLAALLLCWVASTASAFYALRNETLVPFAETGALEFFEGDRFDGYLRRATNLAPVAAAPSGSSVRPTLVVLRDPACRCAFENDLHLRALARAYGERVQWIVLQPRATSLPEWMPDGARLAIAEMPPEPLSVPSAALLDTASRLVFFGPFSLGPGCSGADAFVESALDSVLAGMDFNARRTIGSGCFCKWGEPS